MACRMCLSLQAAFGCPAVRDQGPRGKLIRVLLPTHSVISCSLLLPSPPPRSLPQWCSEAAQSPRLECLFSLDLPPYISIPSFSSTRARPATAQPLPSHYKVYYSAIMLVTPGLDSLSCLFSLYSSHLSVVGFSPNFLLRQATNQGSCVIPTALVSKSSTNTTAPG
jgi:hypothetical protein